MTMFKLSMIILFFLSFLGLNQPAHATPEDWYWTFGLGYAFSHYPSDVEESIDPIKEAGASHFPVAYDLGFYWPSIDDHSVVGVSLHGSTNSYTYDDYNNVSVQQSGVYASYLRFFGSEMGSGFFLRGDAGLSLLLYNLDGSSATSSNTGLGLNAGAGYGFKLSEKTRLILLGVYSYRRVNDGNYTDFTLTIGPMF
jgi:hypothetical protein